MKVQYAFLSTALVASLALASNRSFAGGSSRPINTDKPQDCNFLCDSIPPDSGVLYHISDGASAEALDPSHLKVLVWNIYKQRKDDFVDDFRDLSNNADLVMLEEVALDSDMDRLLSGMPSFGWEMAASFLMNDNIATGVANGSRVPASHIDFRRSRDLEPFSKSPKATIAIEYPIEGRSDTLLTLNIHGVNWRGTTGLEHQIADLEPLLAAHSGPILFAGDFNTKNPERVTTLTQMLDKYGLSSVKWENPESGKQLDQAYARGLVQKKARLVDSDGSDHPALDLEFEFAP
jgi:endonuclease/exonuclease/phosphatase (EEP) superfamily protein YafD